VPFTPPLNALLYVPNIGAQTTITVSSIAQTPIVLSDYITEPNALRVTTILAGLWTVNLHAYRSSGGGDNLGYFANVDEMATNGTTVIGNIYTGTASAPTIISRNQGAYIYNFYISLYKLASLSSRIRLRLYAVSTSGSHNMVIEMRDNTQSFVTTTIASNLVGETGPTGSIGVTGPTGPAGANGMNGDAAGRAFYFDPLVTSDISACNVALISPSTNAETSIPVTVHNTSGNILIASFATEQGQPNVNVLPAGTNYRQFFAVTGAANQVARLVLETWKCSFNGSNQVLLRSTTTIDFNNQQQAITQMTVQSSSFPLLTTDRLIYRLYAAWVSGPNTFTVTTYFDGNARASFIKSTISAGSAGSTGATGPTGAAGTKIYSAVGIPSDSFGSPGDFYIDTSTGILYGPKT
jgi:hypothetical protein